MTKAKISVLGAGNAGYTISFHLAQQGYPVMLFEHPDFKQAVEPINKAGGVIHALEQEGEHKAVIHGQAKVEAATSDIKTVVEFADIVIIIVPAFGQVPIFEMALPHTRDGQIFLVMPGNFASLAFSKLMKEKGVKKQLVFAECETIPYACRRVRENQIFISGVKKNVFIGVFPGNKTDETIAKLTPCIVSKIRKAENVLIAGFSNINMVLHPPPSLFNAGWIETKGGASFSFYHEGISKSVCRYICRIDEERVAIAKACGFELMDCGKLFSWWYELPSPIAYECLTTSPYHKFFAGPASMENRYITEDMAYLLIPMARFLAPKFGVKTPAIDAMVTVAETFLERELKPQREFSVVLKEGETPEQLRERLFTGNID